MSTACRYRRPLAGSLEKYASREWFHAFFIAIYECNENELLSQYRSENRPLVYSSNVGLPNELSIELPERLSIRLSKELSKGLSETAATIYKLIYADNYITRGDIAKKVGVSVTAVQKHINKLKSLKFLDRDGSTGHGNWKILE